jgi:hypothetical protein
VEVRAQPIRGHIERFWQANMRVYGADKIWKQMNRGRLSLPAARLSA